MDGASDPGYFTDYYNRYTIIAPSETKNILLNYNIKGYQIISQPNSSIASATIDENTLTLTGIGVGNTSVEIAVVGTNKTIKINIVIANDTSISLSQTEDFIFIEEGAKNYTVTKSSSSGELSMSSGSNPGVATAELNGTTLTVTPLANGVTNITVYESVGNKTAKITICVQSKSYSITANSVTKYYGDLKSAVTAATTGQTICVEKNVEDLGASAEVYDNKELYLNLQTYTITMSKTIAVDSESTLYIQGTGKITSSSSINTITNNGTLSMATAATIESTCSSSSYAAIANSGTVTISNGTIVGVYKGIYNNSGNTVNMVNISGGLVKATSTSSSAYGIYNYGTNTSYPKTVNITGGTVGATNGGYYGIYNSGVAATTTITGGSVYGYNRAIHNDLSAKTYVGDKTADLSTSSPLISGGTYGVYNSSGKWEYGNGTIQGTTSSFYDNDVTENGGLEGGVRADYIIVTGTSESYKTAHLEKMTDVTSPWLPSGASYTNSDLNTGVTMKDSSNNEWTWVVVPTTITAGVDNITNTTNPTDTPLDKALIQYAATVVTDRGNYKDTWVTGMDSTTYSSGLSSTVYNNKKRKMLNSIKEHGGFWIGKYEVGFTETPTSSNYKSTTRTAVIQKDVYPYNWISCSNANTKAMDLATQAGGEGALLFGTQWDLTLCYLVNRGGVSQRAITYKSTNWGNYKDSNLTTNNNNAKYVSNYTSWYSFSGKNSGTIRVLTTGAAEDTTNKLNIVDFAGNMEEWTLEYSGTSSSKNTLRGGNAGRDGYVGSYQGPSSYRNSTGQSYTSSTGYRATLY